MLVAPWRCELTRTMSSRLSYPLTQTNPCYSRSSQPCPGLWCVLLTLCLSTLTWNPYQTIEVSFGPPTYNRESHPPDQIEIRETAEQESDDEVEIISFRLAPASGPSHSKLAISHDDDDIVVIKTKSESGEEVESEPESDEDVIIVHFRVIPPLTKSLIANRERSWAQGRRLVSKTSSWSSN
jgi:hypothetical protein